jgi:DNA replication and repair protein RecF
VLALKAAEYALLHAAAGEPPILLLDDVLSELDAARRHAFLSSLDGYDQAFITATELPDLPRGVIGSVVEVRAGTLQSANAWPS